MTQASSRLKGTITRPIQTQRGLVLQALGSLILVGALELAFAFSIGGDHVIYFGKGVASFLLIMTLLLVWCGARFERQQNQEEVRRK